MGHFDRKGETELDILGHLEELRVRILFALGALVLMTALSLWQGDKLMTIVRAPMGSMSGKLVFIAPTEAFTAYFKVALLSGFILSFPVTVYHFWKFLAPAFPRRTVLKAFFWILLVVLFFLAGVCFSYFAAMPAALKFLLGFSEGIAEPMITLGRYVSFFGALILAGGIVFEIPVVIALLTDAGLVSPQTLKKKRKYSFLTIMIFSAIITPTHDVVNMLVFVVPMAALYEAGILISSAIAKRKTSTKL